MSLPLPDGVTVEKIVEYVLTSALGGASHEMRIQELTSWGLTEADAEFACDRVFGGAFRAGTANPANEPSADKDPIANVIYRRCKANSALVPALFPERFPQGGR